MGWFEERFDDDHHERHRYDCETCGRGMWFPKCKLGKYRTCSHECRLARGGEEKRLRAKPCETCGKTFIPRPGQLRAGQGRFCSQACNTAGQTAMNSQGAQVAAREAWRAGFDSGRFALASGPKNHRWKGGAEALKPQRRADSAAYKKANPEKVRMWNNNRRCRTHGKLPLDATKTLFSLQKGRCAACRCDLKPGFHLDHITPIVKGGLNVMSNVQLLCPLCNAKKGAKDPHVFMQSLGFLL